MRIRVSVIVPVYNDEKYLFQCVASVLLQSYDFLELILVDDGSADVSGRMCDEFALVDNRITVVQIPPSGVAASRNIGLQLATGDLILFVDSDDWIAENSVSSCVAEFEKNQDLDCLLFTYTKEYNGNSYSKHMFETDLYIASSEEFRNVIYRRLYGLTNDEINHPERLEYITTCWGKMYRREQIKNCRFMDIQQIGSCEDGLFNMDALLNCRTAVYLDSPFYHYRYTAGSLTLKYRPCLSEQWKNLFELMQKRIAENRLSNDFQESLNNRIALSVLGIGMNEMDNPNGNFFQFTGYMKRYISSSDYRTAISTMRLKKLPLPWKMLMLCCKLRFGLGVAVILKAIRMIKNRL